MRNAFVLHHDLKDAVDSMTDAQAGIFLKSIFSYSTGGEVVKTGDSAIDFLFIMVRSTMDRYSEKYEERCKKNRECGALGGKKRAERMLASASECKRMLANASDSYQTLANASERKRSLANGANIRKGKERKEREEENHPLYPPEGDARIIPPRLEWVVAYAKKIGATFDPQKFIAHYDAGGWFRGKTKIKNWQACARTWNQERGGQRATPSRSAPPQLSQAEQERYLTDLRQRADNEIGFNAQGSLLGST